MAEILLFVVAFGRGSSSRSPERYTQPASCPDPISTGTSNSGLGFFFDGMNACLFPAVYEIQESRVIFGGPAARRILPDSLPLRGRVIQIDALPDPRRKKIRAHLRILLQRFQRRLGGIVGTGRERGKNSEKIEPPVPPQFADFGHAVQRLARADDGH